MNLSFLHANLALLGAVVAIAPIIIHLLFKTKPKPIVFPALMLIRKRKTSTVKRLRLQHLLLLAMRIALLALLGLALARPTLHSSLFSIDQQAPVSIALVFDTSPSMSYKLRGKTRMDEARELAVRFLGKLPEGSEVTLIESGNPATAAPIDVAAATGRIKNITGQASTRHLNQSLLVACRSLAKSQKTRREIYVFSDLAQSAWNLSDSAREEVDQAIGLVDAPTKIYCINVGVEKPENVSLGDLALTQQSVPANTELPLTITASNGGPAVQRTATLTIDNEARENKLIPFQAGQAVELPFKIPPLAVGMHTGQIALNAADALEFDDVRYFTLEVRTPTQVLLVADELLDAINFANAIAPENLRRQNRSPFAVYSVTAKELGETDLKQFGLVALLNAGTIPPIGWQRLESFMQAGGGVFVALAERCDPSSYNSKEAQAVLPVKLERDTKPDGAVNLSPTSFTHPVMSRFQAYERSDMSLYPVTRYWKVELPPKGASVILPYSNRAPALIERALGDGRGHCLVFTTAAHYRPAPYAAWNDLPQGWSYVVLMDQIARYLTGLSDTRLNFFVGGQAAVDIDPALGFTIFSVTGPGKQTERFTVGPKDTVLTVPQVKEFGHYRVDAADAKKTPFARGFSVNVPATESNLTPVTDDKLKEILGKDRVAIARDPDKLEAAVDEGRVGKELFSWIMFLAVTVVCVEGYFANRFYRRPVIHEQLAPA